MRIGGNTVYTNEFRWDAPVTNNFITRKVEAEELVSKIVKIRNRMVAAGEITENEPITLIGYSHGGNVSIQAAQMLYDKYGAVVNLITVGTPAKNSTFNADANNPIFGNPEDPQGNDGINEHYHIRHTNDMVWRAADASEDKSDPYYSNDGVTKNWVIPNKAIKLDGGIESHTKLPSHKDFGKALKGLPKMKAAPSPGEKIKGGYNKNPKHSGKTRTKL
jgi:hypothetical protein